MKIRFLGLGCLAVVLVLLPAGCRKKSDKKVIAAPAATTSTASNSTSASSTPAPSSTSNPFNPFATTTPVGPIPEGATPKERMTRKLRTVAGRAAYALRKMTVEPVFGQTRTRGLIRFWFRGVDKVKSEWALWCMGHNLLKLFRSGHVASALE